MAKKRSLYLNEKWDICLTGSGNLQTTTGKYCDAQNVANALRLFTNDAYLRRRKGVPHFALDLGVKPSASEIRAVYRENARAVENILDASLEIIEINPETRVLSGVITATNESGETFSLEV